MLLNINSYFIKGNCVLVCASARWIFRRGVGGVMG